MEGKSFNDVPAQVNSANTGLVSRGTVLTGCSAEEGEVLGVEAVLPQSGSVPENVQFVVAWVLLVRVCARWPADQVVVWLFQTTR